MKRFKFILLFLLAGLVPSFTFGQVPSEPPFPRLAMWWPDVSRPELYRRIASYDWVAVSGSEVDEVLQHIKPLNPALKVGDSVNFTETEAFTAESIRARNAKLLPAEFFLTQAGSTLVAPLTAKQTTIKVRSTRLSTGRPRFVRGDYLLCERETMKVLSVDHRKRTLKVRRGIYRRASRHAPGVRIASAISFWPGTFVMNMSLLAPRVIVDPAIGPENWVEYATRVAGAARPGVDILQIDRTDADQSWLVGEFARSIDPDASNAELSDYAAFDASWNAGMREMLSRVRALNPELAILLNNGLAAFDLVNGSILESPIYWESEGDATDAWHRWFLGEGNLSAPSYQEWLNSALQPNYTLWEIYEDARGPDEVSDDDYDNPAERRGFKPNYRRMRFGLASALLGDGYYSYEISTFVHGGRWLMWFDEYDNAGAGRGYLGYPLGPYTVLQVDAQGRPAFFRRDFQNGIVLVNPSRETRSVSLEGVFRKIRGSQVPSVNDGATASAITLPARDGIILLR